jgi:hypothetical protein
MEKNNDQEVDRFTQLMFGSRAPREEKIDNVSEDHQPSTNSESADLFQNLNYLMDSVQQLSPIVKEIKPMMKQLSPLLSMFNKPKE